MFAGIMSITVKNNNAESATLRGKNELNASGLTMRHPSVFAEHVSIFSFTLLPYFFPFSNSDAW